jgi:ribosomal protein L4
MNKRIEKKQIKQAIKSISTLSVRNGDTIVVTYNQISHEHKLDELKCIYNTLKKVYSNNNNNILFIPDTLSIESLNKEQILQKLQQLIDELK